MYVEATRQSLTGSKLESHGKGRDPLKKNVFFRALPELPKPCPTPCPTQLV